MDFWFHSNDVFPSLSVISALITMAAIAGMIRPLRRESTDLRGSPCVSLVHTLNGRWSVI